MNKRRVILIVILAALAMLGLIGLQFHWVKNVTKIRNASFDNSVEDALKSTVKKVEKHDLSNRLKNHFDSAENVSDLLTMVDSINTMLSYTSDSAYHYPSGHQEIDKQNNISSQDLFSNNNQSRNKQQFIEMLERSTLLSSIFMDMLGLEYTRPVEERITEKYLDSIISSELQKQSIDIPYTFGVIKAPYQSFAIAGSEEYKNELRDTPYSYELFPNNIFREPVYLNIYFPEKRSYIISQMTNILVIAIVLISLLIFSFYYTIHTIFKQKKLSEMKNDFINNMTHEFKTPISTISLACQTLNDDEIPKDEKLYHNYIKVIEEENTRLGSMAEKVLQTAIIDKGTLQLKFEIINMHKVITNAISKIKMQIEQKGGTIKTDLQATNPVIRADRFHMTNVVFNLLDNANKYSLNEPHILVKDFNKSNGFQLEVSDNGIGISKAHQQKIFDKLYRVPTGDIHNVKGFGLGLSYVKAIIDKHNGSIDIQSELNKGSTFIIFIPFQSNEETL
ncbi:MAG: sensor histidine kinase [Bacteroidales bacterium]